MSILMFSASVMDVHVSSIYGDFNIHDTSASGMGVHPDADALDSDMGVDPTTSLKSWTK